MLNLIEYLVRRLRQVQIDPALVGLAAGIGAAVFLWKKGRRLLFFLVSVALMIRWAQLHVHLQEEH